jgi:hypothetical protein
LFESIVEITFQSVFCSEMHQNNIFFYFLHQNIKRIQKHQKKFEAKKKKNSRIFKSAVRLQCQTVNSFYAADYAILHRKRRWQWFIPVCLTFNEKKPEDKLINQWRNAKQIFPSHSCHLQSINSCCSASNVIL